MTTHDNPLADYEHLHRIMTERMSMRRLKPDPIPDDYITKVVEAGRWAMSGANSQPWEFIVVKDEMVNGGAIMTTRSGAGSAAARLAPGNRTAIPELR